MKVVIKKGKIRYYYLLVASNGEILLHSQHYFSKGNANRAGDKLASTLKIKIEKGY